MSQTKGHLMHIYIILFYVKLPEKLVGWNNRAGRLAEKLTLAKCVGMKSSLYGPVICVSFSTFKLIWYYLLIINYLPISFFLMFKIKVYPSEIMFKCALIFLELCLSSFQSVSCRWFMELNRIGKLKSSPSDQQN